MKKISALVAFTISTLWLSQTPVFQDKFDKIPITNTNFTFYDNNGVKALVDNIYNESNSAIDLSGTHRGIDLKLDNPSSNYFNSLKTEGTIEFFHKVRFTVGTSITDGMHSFVQITEDSADKSILNIGYLANSPGAYKIAAFNPDTNSMRQVTSTDGYILYHTWAHVVIQYKFGTGGYIKVFHNGKLAANLSIAHNTNPMKPIITFGTAKIYGGFNVSGATMAFSDVKVYTGTQDADALFKKSYLIDRGSQTIKYKFDGNLNDVFGARNLIQGGGGFPYMVNHDNVAASVIGINPHTNVANLFGKVPTSINNHLGNNYTVSFAYKSANVVDDNSSNNTVPIITIPTTNASKPIIIGVNKATTPQRPLNVKIGTSDFTSTSGIHNNAWSHATVVMRNGKMDVYVDGDPILKDIDVSAEINSVSSTENILIGKSENPLDWFRGYLDDLVIDSKSYTSAEAKSAYTQWKNSFTSMTNMTDITLGATDIEKSSLTIYPNPTTDFITINQKDELQSVEIYSMTGNLVKKSSNAKQIDVRGLSAGIYILKATSKNGTFISKKIIKK